MGHRSNYDWRLFVTSPMAFTGVRTHDSVCYFLYHPTIQFRADFEYLIIPRIACLVVVLL